MTSVSHPLSQSQASVHYIHEKRATYDAGPRRFAPMIPPELMCPEVDPRSFQVYCVLAAHASTTTGECSPAIETIAARLGTSDRTVQRSIKHLESLGYIYITNRSAQNLPNIYALPLQVRKGVTSATVSDLPGDKYVTSPVTYVSQPGDKYDADLVTSMSPKQSAVNREIEQTTTTRARAESPPPMNGHSKWIEMIERDNAMPKIVERFRSVSSEFTETIVRGALITAEKKAGEVTADELQNALREALAAIKRRMEAEKQGGRPIESLMPFTGYLVSQKVLDARGLRR